MPIHKNKNIIPVYEFFMPFLEHIKGNYNFSMWNFYNLLLLLFFFGIWTNDNAHEVKILFSNKKKLYK